MPLDPHHVSHIVRAYGRYTPCPPLHHHSLGALQVHLLCHHPCLAHVPAVWRYFSTRHFGKVHVSDIFQILTCMCVWKSVWLVGSCLSSSVSLCFSVFLWDKPLLSKRLMSVWLPFLCDSWFFFFAWMSKELSFNLKPHSFTRMSVVLAVLGRLFHR